MKKQRAIRLFYCWATPGGINKAFDKVNGKYLPGDERRDRVDLFGSLWGTIYIVFPNAVYGDWVGTVEEDKRLLHSHLVSVNERIYGFLLH